MKTTESTPFLSPSATESFPKRELHAPHFQFLETLAAYPQRCILLSTTTLLGLGLAIYLGTLIGQQDYRTLTLFLGAILFALTLIYPRAYLVAFSLACGLWPGSFGHGSQAIYNLGNMQVYMGDLFSGTALLLVLVNLATRRRVFHFDSPLNRPLHFWYGWGAFIIAIGVITTGYHGIGETRYFFIFSVLYTALPLLIRNLADLDFFLKWWWFGTILTLVEAAYLYLARGAFNPAGIWNLETSDSTGGLWIATGVVVLSTAVFAIAYFTTLKKAWTKFLTCAYVLVTFMLVVGGSVRTNATALVGGILFLLVVMRTKMLAKMSVALLFVTVTGGTLFFMEHVWRANFGDFLAKRYIWLHDPAADPDTNWRLQGWSQFIEKIKASPIIGEPFGQHTMWEISPGNFQSLPPHNDYLFVAVKMGIPGLLIFLGIVVGAFRIAYQRVRRTSDPRERAMMVGFAGVLGVNLAAAMTFGISLTFWPAIALIAYLPTLYASERNAIGQERAPRM